jgi:DNA-binding transcriptional LysR family regulator
MRSLSDQEVFLKLGSVLLRSNRVASMGQLAKLAHVGDDMARRCIERLKKQFQKELIKSVDGRLCLTDAGKKLLHLFNELLGLAENGEEQLELLTVEADALLVESLLPEALRTLLELWISFIQLRICPLDWHSVRQHINDGITSVGIGWGDGSETIPAAEVLGPKMKMVLLVPRHNHRLAEYHESVTAEQLRGDDRVFADRQTLARSDLNEILTAVPPANRIECDSVVRFVATGLGLGVIPDVYGNQEIAGVDKLVIQNVEPVQLQLFLLRHGAGALSEPLQCLVEALRKAIESRYVTEEPAPDKSSAVVVNGSQGEQLLTSLEETHS